MKKILLLGGIAVTSSAFAVDSVVPNAFAATEGPSVFSLTTNTTGGRTYQFVIDSSQLTSLVNTNLTSMAFRLNSGGNWPTLPVSMSFFDVYVGASVDPSAITTSVASNFTGAVTQVRSGAISFNPGDFPTGGTPNGFGPSINFNLSTYNYTGGDLSILLRYDTQVGVGGTPSQSPFDGIAATDTANGYGSLFAARWSSGSTATTVGSTANFIITNLSGTAVPEPATMAALGFGAAALLRRRKK